MIDKLMITAHPDDEALFGGAELLTHPTEYKVVVVDEYHNVLLGLLEIINDSQ